MDFWIVFLVAVLTWAAITYWRHHREAVRLNLRVLRENSCGYLQDWHMHERIRMAKIGDTLVATISPVNEAGQPAPVFSVTYDEFGDSYDITPNPDGLSATLVAKVSGTGNSVIVTATTKSGAQLMETLDLPDVDFVADEEAVSLQLRVSPASEPVPA
jgi:hypothetical protein